MPFTDDQVKAVESRISYFSHDSLWNPPYDWHVMVPAYMTYVEPTLTCFLVAFLIWDRLPEQRLLRYGSFSIIVTSLNGVLSHPLIYPFFSKLSFGVAVLSAGQFFSKALRLLSSQASFGIGRGRVNEVAHASRSRRHDMQAETLQEAACAF